jgi:hypothetical protein
MLYRTNKFTLISSDTFFYRISKHELISRQYSVAARAGHDFFLNKTSSSPDYTGSVSPSKSSALPNYSIQRTDIPFSTAGRDFPHQFDHELNIKMHPWSCG